MVDDFDISLKTNTIVVDFINMEFANSFANECSCSMKTFRGGVRPFVGISDLRNNKIKIDSRLIKFNKLLTAAKTNPELFNSSSVYDGSGKVED